MDPLIIRFDWYGARLVIHKMDHYVTGCNHHIIMIILTEANNILYGNVFILRISKNSVADGVSLPIMHANKIYENEA